MWVGVGIKIYIYEIPEFKLLLQLLGHLLLVAKKVANDRKLDNGYRVGKNSNC